MWDNDILFLLAKYQFLIWAVMLGWKAGYKHTMTYKLREPGQTDLVIGL